MAGDRAKDDVRRYYAAWSAGDVETMVAIAHPELEARPLFGMLYERQVYRGHDGLRSWLGELERDWQSFEPRVLDLVEHDGTVIAFVRLIAWRDGRDFDAHVAIEHAFRDGRIAELRSRDWAEVREELGREP